MTPYSEHPTAADDCPKCGERSDWYDESESYTIEWKPTYRLSSFTIGDRSHASELDYIMWSCPACGYSISTECKDAVMVPA